MAVIYTPHFAQFFDADGNPLSGGKLYTYAAGTTTPKATYTTYEGNVANTNPIILDSAGRATLFLTGSYKFTLTDENDVVLETTDNITAFSAQTESTEGFFQSFSGDGSTTSFTLSDDLGADEKSLMIFTTREYTTNGLFASDTGWTKGTGWTIAAGVATATGAISTALEQSAANTLIEGRAYSVKFTITRAAGSITLSLGGTAGTSRSADGTYSETIIAGSTQTISFGTTGFTGTVDNVTITSVGGQEILNPNEYTVNGTALTLTKPPATGTNNILVFAPYSLIGAAGAAQTAADDAIAAQEAAEAAVGAVAVKYTFDSSTSMADPGAGDFRLNNATIASATAMAFDATCAETGNPDVSDIIAQIDSSTNPVKGQIKITKSGSPEVFAFFNVTDITDNTGWLEAAVTYVSGSGTLSNTDVCYIQFTRFGNKGDTGSQGPSGTVSGASSTAVANDDKILFLDTSGADGLSSDTVLDVVASALLDEDDMASDSATRAPTQQSVKAYVDAAGGSGLLPIQTQTVSSPTASVTFTGLTGGKKYVLDCKNVIPATDAAIPWLRVGDSGGIDSGASDYNWAVQSAGGGAGANEFRTNSADDSIELFHQDGIGTDSGEFFSATITISGGTSSLYPLVRGVASGIAPGAPYTCDIVGQRTTAITMDRIQFLFSTGNIESGVFTLYEVAEA